MNEGELILYGMLVILAVFSAVMFSQSAAYENNAKIEVTSITVFSKVHGQRAVDDRGIIIDTIGNKYIAEDNIYVQLNEGRNYTVGVKQYEDGKQKIINATW
jgi:hypothetical protein